MSELRDTRASEQVKVLRARQRERHNSSLQSGYSLMARGEPQIWFTGGMLVVCIAMILGLLTLILVRGLPTFWPTPVNWLVLNDGTQEIGQWQSIRQVPTTVATPEPSSGSSLIADAGRTESFAENRLEPTEQPGTQYYYRTGNFDLTQRHFRWLDEQELTSAGITTPRWALVVERQAWGRLYGLPLQFIRRVPLAQDASVQDPLKILLHALVLSEKFSSGLEDPALERQRLACLQELQFEQAKRLDAELRDSIRQTLVSHQPSSAFRLQILRGDTEEWQPLDSDWAQQSEALVPRPQGMLLTDARVVVQSSFFLLETLQEALAELKLQGAKVQRLKRQISRVDADVSRLRLEVRRAELRAEEKFLPPFETLHPILERQIELQQCLQQLQQLQETPDRPLLAQLNDRLVPLVQQVTDQILPKEQKILEGELLIWLQPVKTQSALIRDAVERYLTGYRQAIVAKTALQRELHAIERSGPLVALDLAVPNSPTLLEGLAAVDATALRDGNLTQPMRDALRTQSVITEAASDAVDVEQLSDSSSLIQFNDTAGERYAMTAIQVTGEGTPATTQVSLLQRKTIGGKEIVRAVAVSRLGLAGKFSVYLDRWREFLWEMPREANSEGGVFPAIWGTIVMTLIMTIAVVPFGVMAALFLREYAGTGVLVSLIRISINNLAGVPSIVYGVFGFSFFCYTLGAFVDGGAKNADIVPWPSAIWFIMLALAAVLGTAAFFASLLAGGPTYAQPWTRRMVSRLGLLLWLTCLGVSALLILKSPFFGGFYAAQLPNPTFGKGGLLWASLTLALLTLPVVIVATEEALAAVPNSLREGSLACGASQWQTILRIVLPHARPGILTGAILAMARGAGEVAPLMLVGALPTAPDLPLDTEFPFLHGSRSFMHLGYQIYSLGFQSQNSEAAVPMVFTCTLLLIAVVALLNLSAIWLRARLKRHAQDNQF
ncbi:phosphate ABC transporter permease PstA [Aureliella helgolandensis]|uniref:Phosphate transport system permease protein PstA n=1 Tax=Aureliella helgolandensis TaxID=2527968 RepID=A0A518G8J6_9BACT|nr:phosphate ABC transporter permease PstA [Aureliella helgolandensis]QDV24906.1 Phosphate transport system permease protein PstA [Aureliella helgolandensis]